MVVAIVTFSQKIVKKSNIMREAIAGLRWTVRVLFVRCVVPRLNTGIGGDRQRRSSLDGFHCADSAEVVLGDIAVDCETATLIELP